MTGSGTAVVTLATALNGGTIDAESGTLSIQSTDSTWTGGTVTAAAGDHGRQLAARSTWTNGVTLDRHRHLYRLAGRRPGPAQRRHPA